MHITIAVPEVGSIPAILSTSADARACLVFAHGAGAGMAHPFMTAVSDGLTTRGIAVLRYNFPFMEAGSKRVDPLAKAQAAVKAAVEEAGRRMPGLPLFAGGKSFGGRMSSQAQAKEALPGISGLVFIGFPLHPAGKPSIARGEHLRGVHIPMLFLQGIRDGLADAVLIRGEVQALGGGATLHMVNGADHSFHVLKRSGRTDCEVLDEILDATTSWLDHVVLP